MKGIVMSVMSVMRGLAWVWWVMVVAAVLGGPGPAARDARAAGVEKPNILFIMLDDLGKEWVSCYGAEGIETPVMDELAAGGMKFTNAYCMPQCTPTRATLLTGQYPFRTGWINHWDVPRWWAGCHFDPKHNVTFARVMKSGGYATAIAGKWQINDFRVQPNVLAEHGFDDWCMWTGGEGGNAKSNKRYWEPYIHTREGSHTYRGAFGPDVYTSFLIEFMREHREEPMMLYFPMALTHGPLVHTPAEPGAEGKYERHEAMVRYTDELIGRLVDALEDLGIRERTIIFVTTDNGTSRGITGRRAGREVRGGKASLGENGPCVPFIVNGPGMVSVGVETGVLTDFTDMLPTFAELGGAEVPEGWAVDGHSIADVILGEAEEGPREWIMAMGFGPALLDEKGVRPVERYTDRVVRDERWKLWVLDGEPARLHDLENDPWEEENLIDSADPAAVAAKKKLAAVVAGFPARDGRPRYDPLPAQAWDVTIEEARKRGVRWGGGSTCEEGNGGMTVQGVRRQGAPPPDTPRSDRVSRVVRTRLG